jgi:chemotaxis signal transduction protein
MQLPDAPQQTMGLVMTRVGPFNLAFDFAQVHSLIHFEDCVEIPEQPDGFFRGKIRYRRHLLPLIALEQKLLLPPTATANGEALILKLLDECLVALHVDEIIELNTQTEREYFPLPVNLTHLDSTLLPCWVEVGGAAGYLVDIERLFDEGELEAISTYLF